MTTQEQTAAPTPSEADATGALRGAAPLLRGLGLALAVLSVLAGSLSLAGSLARDHASLQASYRGVRTVDVDVDVESVELVAGTGQVTQLDRTISWSLGRPAMRQRQVGDRLVIGSDCPFSFGRGCSGRVRVVVPPGTRVRAHSSASSVEATGLDGVLDLSSSAGDVDGTGLGAGAVDADSSAGDVDLSFGDAPTTVRATSSAGSVAVVVPPGSGGYRVDAGSSAGSSNVNVRTDPSSARRIFAYSSAGDVDVAYGR